MSLQTTAHFQWWESLSDEDQDELLLKYGFKRPASVDNVFEIFTEENKL